MTIQLVIRSKTKTVFDGLCSVITSVNDIGEFDMLPMHANIISVVRGYVVLDKGSTTQKSFEFKQGILKFYENRAEIYITD